ncbi:DUF167 domain-containing protein [Candidatus Woesearchaeota archaeon]|jgi:uncharacterized protein (TIGR00251 family)|nr:DUF167 domain-containing protein [Candidatus Woesearchaeota archaeon]MBT4150649.1 DUF167 domain-containing protein [Candidatus Woesearchaeota archaeon]MBT4247867.1 DUF167 domain-containing protein [Candidatus Woesearchaeota archaeon]MBT4434291.1 DUF167 domain-containing protein [Candidatus Woesearchaeota archaeon]MBT7331880.1 DUF167 domain-containing protein [Candidatus Woesearchaeota archaeon]
MDIQKHIFNHLLSIKVIPNASQTKLIEENNQLKLYLSAIPDKNKANIQLLKFFKKEFKLKVEIKSGARSRNKVLRILE